MEKSFIILIIDKTEKRLKKFVREGKKLKNFDHVWCQCHKTFCFFFTYAQLK